MSKMRTAIIEERFLDFRQEFLAQYNR
jgi:queuine/archaeosine tRNA-ribosyltransferase